MRKTARNVLSLLVVIAFAFSALPHGGARPVQASTSGVVISQVYAAGGNSGATYTHDFIELFNAGTSPVSLNGWSLQYTSPAGTGNFGSQANQITELPDVTLQPGQYYLVQEASGGVNGTPLPTTADLVDATPIGLGAAGGKVALAKIATTLGCNGNPATPCNAAQLANIEDLVGYGTANFHEGTSPALAPSTTTAILRANGGCTDTDENGTDFIADVPSPRNMASPRKTCGAAVDNPPAVSSTSPKNNDTGVFVEAPIIITFSEPVDTADGWYQFSCASGATPALTVTGGPTTFTLTHTADFPTGASCTFAIPDPELVKDRDGTADALTSALSFTFTVETPVDLCAQQATPIYDIQGSGATSPLAGQKVVVKGVVTGDFEDPATGMKGFYLQEQYGDGDINTSDGIFVYNNNTEDRVNEGEIVSVAGTVGEFSGQTQISSVTDWAVCQISGQVTPVDVDLPVDESTLFEPYEGMLVRFPQQMVISEYYQYDQYGEIVLALPLEGEPRPFTGTALEEPGPEALARTLANSLRRITLDDNIGTQNPAVLRHPNGDPFSPQNNFRGGDIVQNAIGVLGYNFSKYRIYPTGPAEHTPTNPRPATPEDVGGDIRVAAMNTLNYFLTPDYPTGNANDNKCGPLQNMECRGWDSDQANELTRQRAKLLEALKGLDADVIGLNEIENTPSVEPLADIVAGMPGYGYIETGVIGTDAIRVGIIYRTAAVTPVGDYQLLTTAVDSRFLDTKNRPSLAQTFEVNATQERFTVAVNHFKSKGSGCTDVGDPDRNDGQGNCSQTRMKAGQALVDWLASDPTNSGDPDFLILGDLNSYAMEDTIEAVKVGADDIAGTSDDFINLIEAYQGRFAYSYTFDMQAGYLDHALASFNLFTQVTGATEWHINSDEPDVVDYDTSYKPVGQENLYEVNPFRASDHDPVVVGLALTGDPSNTAPIALGDAYEVAEDGTLTVDAPGVLANDIDAEGDTLTAVVAEQPATGSVEMQETGAFTFTPDTNFTGTETFTYTVSDGELTATATVTITVKPEADAPEAVDDAYETDEDTTLEVAAPGVLSNDYDVDGDTLTVEIVTGPQHGTVELLPVGGFTYQPDENFNGTDTFTYSASDGGLTDTATVTITIKPVDEQPIAQISVDINDPEEGEMITFTAGLVDPDNGQPVAFSPNAAINWDFGGLDTGAGASIPYAFMDDGQFNVTLEFDDPVYGTGVVMKVVQVSNVAPAIASIAPITIAERKSISQQGSFTDPGIEDTWTATVDYGDGDGEKPLTLANGKFTLSHQYWTAGDYTITIVLTDDDGGTDTLTVTVTVEPRVFHFLPIIGN